MNNIPEEEIAIFLNNGRFDAEWYSREYPDVAMLGMSPAEHYLLIGAKLGRRMSSSEPTRAPLMIASDGHLVPESSARARSAAQIEAAIMALPCRDTVGANIDVIVPIYKSIEESLSCLLHVLESPNRLKYGLVVIDDCSPEAELSAALSRIAAFGHIDLLVNSQNLGFVRTVNRGMARNPARDVILLNSDTEVFGDWIDRLHRNAYSDPHCGSVTPLTNNGEICSYPVFVRDNPEPLELSYAELDTVAREVNRGKMVTAPTAVGFCMYIKREVIDAIGDLDAEAFGRGYGEENDFCLRAQAAGWRDVICGDVFVRHLGSVSFQDEKAELIRNHLKIIEQRYPRYFTDVQSYLAADPVREMRSAIDRERLRRQKRDRNVLIISHHGRGGGSKQHVDEEVERLLARGYGVFRLRMKGGDGRVIHFHDNVPRTPNLGAMDIRQEKDEILALWEYLGITEIHIHHLIDFGTRAAHDVADLLQASRLPCRITIHDYFAICPRIHLADGAGFYCGEPDMAACMECLATHGSETGIVDMPSWREGYARLLGGANMVIVPDNDVLTRLHRYFDTSNVVIQPHEIVDIALPLTHRARRSGPTRVVTLGAISDIKGFHVLIACAEHARQHGLPLSFHVIGYTMDDPRAKAAGISVSGAYAPGEALPRLRAAEPDLVFFPFTWPETYSYTLSVALQAGLPLATFDIGAPARRLREAGVGRILPLDMARDAGAINAALMEAIA